MIIILVTLGKLITLVSVDIKWDLIVKAFATFRKPEPIPKEDQKYQKIKGVAQAC